MFRRVIKHKTISFYFFSRFSFSCLVSASSAKQNYQKLGCLYDNRGRGVSVDMPREFTVEMLEDDWGGPVAAAVVERLPRVFRCFKRLGGKRGAGVPGYGVRGTGTRGVENTGSGGKHRV